MSSVKTLVDRGLAIRADLKRLKKELDDITARLEKLGLAAPQEELADEGREGRRWFAKGTALRIPVVFTADKIVGEFKDGSPLHARIKAAAGTHLTDFFRAVNKHENLFDDGKKFRTHAKDIFGDAAPDFVVACRALDKDGLPKSDIKILWDAGEEVAS